MKVEEYSTMSDFYTSFNRTRYCMITKYAQKVISIVNSIKIGLWKRDASKLLRCNSYYVFNVTCILEQVLAI